MMDTPWFTHFLKSINPKTSIDVSNLMDEIDKVKILKFGNNAKDILYYMYPNHTIIIEKDEIFPKL